METERNEIETLTQLDGGRKRQKSYLQARSEARQMVFR